MLNIYKASAGAGKTYTLTREYIKLLFKKENNYRKTLAVTFTNNACDEMKSRILEALYELSYNPDAPYLGDLREIDPTKSDTEIQEKAHRIFRDLLHNYSFFFIETIDSFTQRVIRNFAKDLNLPPKFSLELDPDTILETIIRKLLTNSAENPELHKLLIDFAFEDIDSNKQTNLKKEIKEASKLLFEEKFQAENSGAVTDFETLLQGMHTFFKEQSDIIKDYEKEVCGYAKQAIEAIANAGLTRDDFKKSGKASCIDVLQKIANKDFSKNVDKILTADVATTKKLDAGKRMIIEQLYNQKLEELYRNLLPLLEDCETKRNYYTAKKYVEHKQGIILSQYIQSELEAYCRDENAFFLSFANMLLKGIINQSDTPFVYEKIGQQIENIMIDEFQDTSNMQWDNFKPIISNLLSAQTENESSGYGLIIGDVKQSIYRFRNGDWKILHNLTNPDSEEFTVNDHSSEIKTNFRSYKNIIDFNNIFFELYSKFVDARFNQEFKTEKNTISKIYEDCAQNTKKEAEGCVEVQLINPDGKQNAAEAKEARLQAIFDKVVSLLENGRNAEDIMILCYKNNTIGEIVDYFNQKKNEEAYKKYENAFSIMSKQALLIDSAPSVQFIINYLQRMTMTEKDKGREFVDASLAFHYQTMFPNTFADSSQMLDISVVPNITIDRNMSIFDTCEQIILRYKLNTITSEIPFITNFQDIVHNYSKNNNTNISHFLEHWDEIKDNTYLSQSKRIGSLQAATIHSSKGLQYPVVILPDFAKISLPQYAHALYKTNDDRLSIVKLEGDMKNTNFKDEFVEEMYLTEIDNINALYVACTRAEEELYIFDVCNSKNAANKKNLFDKTIEPLDHDEYENYTFRKGVAKGSKKQGKQSNGMGQYMVFQPAAKLLPEKNSRHFEDKLNQPQTQREHGLLMHQILEHITTIEDIDRCILQYTPVELIDEQERTEIAQSLRQKISDARIAPWFDNSWDAILSEQTLMLPEGIERRPDRMLLRGNEITVIDYKFTKEHEESHIKQVREYMHILSQMGYTTKGYIWYVDLDDIVDVA